MMKKWLSLLLALTFVLTGCSDTGTESLSTSNTVEQNVVQETEEKVDQAVEQEAEQSQSTSSNTASINESTSTMVTSQYPTYQATVKKVTDGDTLQILTEDGKTEKVRLLLVDTPESVKPNSEQQLYGVEASDFVKGLLKEGTVVTVEPGVEGSEYDRYGRLLAYIYVNGEMLNKTLVSEGYARVGYIYAPNTRYLEELQAAQAEAKAKKLRIWSIDGYVTDKGYDMDVVNGKTTSTTTSTSTSTNDSQSSAQATATEGKIKGNKNSLIYHVPGGRFYDSMSEKNVQYFDTVEEAEAAGYRASKQ